MTTMEVDTCLSGSGGTMDLLKGIGVRREHTARELHIV